MNDSGAPSLDAVGGAAGPSPVATEDVLRALGFREDRNVLSDFSTGLSLDFGNFKIQASHNMNRWLRPVVTLGGVMTMDRTIGLVHFEMPPEVESFEQGVAFVTYCLDTHAGGVFKPSLPMPWLSQGREYRYLLPWEKKSAEYAARPHCYVERDWARLALRDLSKFLASMNDDRLVIFRFDGDVLTIRCPGKAIAVRASGEPWPTCYSISATMLQELPRRFMSRDVEFSVWDRKLQIGNRRYTEVAACNADGIQRA